MFSSDFEMPVAFHFNVVMVGLPIPVLDTAFQEVSGLESEMDLDQIWEGGENRYQHKLPKAVKHPNLVLKRGLSNMISGLVVWCKASLEADMLLPIQTNIVMVNLMNAHGIPIRSWVLDRAYPVKWSVGGFDAMKNEMAIETVELAYHSSMRML